MAAALASARSALTSTKHQYPKLWHLQNKTKQNKDKRKIKYKIFRLILGRFGKIEIRNFFINTTNNTMATFTLEQIHNDVEAAKAYLAALQSHMPCSLKELIEHARQLSPELGTFSENNGRSFGARDKGSAGKIVEFHIFGRLPNSESTPDLFLGDVKATHIKRMANGYNAKERLTLTNVGATKDYANLQHILDYELEENPRWAKVRQGILVVMEHTEGQWPAEEKTLNERVVALFHYDIAACDEWMKVIRQDYEKIRDCVRAKAATQKGQTYLHIHPHGSKDSTTRAFGFTNKFVTRLICHYTGRQLITCGRSLLFE